MMQELSKFVVTCNRAPKFVVKRGGLANMPHRAFGVSVSVLRSDDSTGALSHKMYFRQFYRSNNEATKPDLN